MKKKGKTSWFVKLSPLWLILFLLIKSAYPFFTIPTPSMAQTLRIGDLVVGNKLTYGYRIPYTMTRLPATGRISRNDIVIFNYPIGDTMITERPDISYYEALRQAEYELKTTGDHTTDPRQKLIDDGDHIATRAIYNREVYLKRCVAVAGETLRIENGELYVDGIKQPEPADSYMHYTVKVPDPNILIDTKIQDRYQIELTDQPLSDPHLMAIRIPRTKVDSFAALLPPGSMTAFIFTNEFKAPTAMVFPNNFKYYNWSIDNFGPVVVPKKGMTLHLTDSTLCQYSRLISVYEGNKLEQRDGKIFINGKETTEYTCQMDYYWMMGDNRHNSMDSRFWGFLPADHLLAKASTVFCNLNSSLSTQEKTSRIFKKID